MTEKRFKLGYVCGDFGLIDNDEWIDLHSMSENSEKNVKLCINKMNELAEENEKLKKEVRLFDGVEHNWGIMYDEAKEAVKELEKENEQLKKDLLEVHEICAYYESRIKELKGDVE